MAKAAGQEALAWLHRARDDLGATEFRYPSDSPDPDPQEIGQALELAGQVITAIEQRIGAGN